MGGHEISIKSIFDLRTSLPINEILYTIHKYLYTTDKLFISGEISVSATTQNLGICFFCTEHSNIR
jgi:hypothetical protein